MNKIEKIIKKYEMIYILVFTFLFLWVGFMILIAGKELYGGDASLLWASGILTYMGIKGFASIILYIWNRR